MDKQKLKTKLLQYEQDEARLFALIIEVEKLKESQAIAKKEIVCDLSFVPGMKMAWVENNQAVMAIGYESSGTFEIFRSDTIE